MTEEQHPCPECNGSPTPESLAEQNLSDLGYLHDDRFLICEDCDYQWTVGLPRGTIESDDWECDACGGDFMPHFIYDRGEYVDIRPKCQSCYWVPDEPITRTKVARGNGDRIFIGHHTITGEREDAEFL